MKDKIIFYRNDIRGMAAVRRAVKGVDIVVHCAAALPLYTPEDSFVSIDKAMKQLGWKPKYSNKEALLRTYDRYLAHYKEYENRSGVTHRVPWKQGILKLVSWFF